MSQYAVIRTRGDSWQSSRSMEDQADWDAHASFMNALVRDGFVLLGGPLERTCDVLLIIRASGLDQIVTRLESDPWTINGLLRIRRTDPWTLRVGSLG